MAKTQLKKLFIEKFRALEGVSIEVGEYLTVICGKNGTSKSSILGVAAQIFNFEKDYVSDFSLQSFRQITGAQFKSAYSEHFRISKAFDLPGSMKVGIELHDGYTDQEATATLQLDRRGGSPRPVVRKNSTATGNLSRNFTHPVVFLSLKRLYPITDRDYSVHDFEYLQAHRQDFIDLTNELLNRSSSHATGTKGTISSAVSHGDNYDQDSVSAGEDNAGQIVLALLSFRKLKEEYSDYKGGLLLIDEADSGLFPAAQINLLNILARECRALDLQVMMTTHSPVLIKHTFDQHKKHQARYKTIYLTDSYGSVQPMQDWSWEHVEADITARLVRPVVSAATLPEINVYFEDGEGADFFDGLIFRQPLKKFLRPMSDITLGCENFLHLIKNNVPEFCEKSVVCLDADVSTKLNKGVKYTTLVLLPGQLPPDQLIFEFLYNLSPSDPFWKNNELMFTRAVFTNNYSEIIGALSIAGPKVNLAEKVKAYSKKNAAKERPRELFKGFYKSKEFQALLSAKGSTMHPWRYWVEKNPELTNQFLNKFLEVTRNVMSKGHSIAQENIDALKVSLKKV